MRFLLWKCAWASPLIHIARVVAVTATIAVAAPGGLRDVVADPAWMVTVAPTIDDSGIGRLYSALTDCRGSLPEEERRVIADVIVSQSNRHGYDPLFVQAIVEVESTCRPTALSSAGAVGLIQVKPSTGREVADRYGILWEGADGLLRPEVNVELGLHYLAQLEERFSDPILAIAAYNLGPNRVARMEPQLARRAPYVRKVMNRYEGLLLEYPTTRS